LNDFGVFFADFDSMFFSGKKKTIYYIWWNEKNVVNLQVRLATFFGNMGNTVTGNMNSFRVFDLPQIPVSMIVSKRNSKNIGFFTEKVDISLVE